jgi:hypothetical protein
MITTMIFALIAATLAVHLGLADAVKAVINKILSCAQCLTFWMCLLFLVVRGISLLPALAGSLAAAYVSNWAPPLLLWLQKKYNNLLRSYRK